MTDCFEVINNFLLSFDIFINSEYVQKFSDLLSLVKDDYFNNNHLQKIFPINLIEASQLFNKDDVYKIVCAFYQGEKFQLTEDLQYMYKYFQKFLNLLEGYISFRNQNPSIYIIDKYYINSELKLRLNFLGWNITDTYSKNIDFILSKGADNESMKDSRFITNTNLGDIINPPSVYQVIYQEDKLKTSEEYIAFDLDGTLINSSNKLLPRVKEGLKKLYDSGYNLVVISNQKRRKIGDPKLKEKLNKIFTEIDLPIIVFCAREENVYRKPDIGCTYLIPKSFGKMKEFVGDAAGRIRDHSDDDLQFANNYGVIFKTPEKYFR